jgi:hypothetical protein
MQSIPLHKQPLVQMIGIALCVFLIILSVRIWIFDQAISDLTFAQIRQAQLFNEQHTPLITDQQSYTGRTYIVNPLTALIFSIIPISTIPYIGIGISVCLGILIALISRVSQATILASIVGGVFLGLHPFILYHTTSQITSMSFALIAFVLSIWSTLKALTNQWPHHYALLMFTFASILHPISLIFIPAYCFYAIINWSYGQTIDKTFAQTLFIQSILALTIQYILYYQYIAYHGISVFFSLSVFNSFITPQQVAVLLPYCGLFYLVFALGVSKNNLSVPQATSTLLFSILFSCLLATLIGFISASLTLAMVGICLAFFTSEIVRDIQQSISQTNFVKNTRKIIFIIFVVLGISSVLGTLLYIQTNIQSNDTQTIDFSTMFTSIQSVTMSQSNQTDDQKNAINFSDDLIITPVSYAHQIMHYSNAQTYVDSYTLGVKDALERESYINAFYSMKLRSQLIDLAPLLDFDQYHKVYVIMTDDIKKQFGDVTARIDCFTPIYHSENSVAELYEVNCI